MKAFNKPLALGAVLLGLMSGAGCGTVVEGGGDGGAVGVDVYGADEGPWDYGAVEYGGVGHVRPPYHAEDDHRAVDDHRGGDDHARSAPAPARSAPSIPNHARPSGGGGGGGGHPSGGGGGHPSSGDHKH